MLNAPGRARLEYDEQLAHAGGEGHLLQLAGRQEPLIDIPDDGIETAGNHCSHVQDSAEPRPPIPNLPLTSQRAAVAVGCWVSRGQFS